MSSHVIDILLDLMGHLRNGKALNDYPVEMLKHYEHAEVGAAYSWLFTKYPELLKNGHIEPIQNADPTHRVLHMAEQMMIGKEAYGYLLRLLYSGLIDMGTMEHLIERVMLHHSERITLEKLKDLLDSVLLEKTKKGRRGPSFHNLSGNEKIH
jgi:uncharacterized protein Smg (DUF494 family)